MRKLIVSLFLANLCSAQIPPHRIPFWGAGWEEIVETSFEYQIVAKEDRAEKSISQFLETLSLSDLRAKALEHVGTLHHWNSTIPDPAENQIYIETISFRGVPRFGDEFEEGVCWFVEIGLYAWGNRQISGVPVSFSLIYIPGTGFKMPKELEDSE